MSYLPEIHRLLPQAPDAERALLSSYVQSSQWVGGLCAEKQVKAEHFHNPAHAAMYSVLSELWEVNKPVDVVTFPQELHDRGRLEDCGGLAFVTETATYMPTAFNAPAYIEILHEQFTRREVIRVCTEYAARGYDEGGDPAAMLDELEAKILAIRKSDDSELREQEPKALVMQVLDRIEQMYERRGEIFGLPTGFKLLDDMLDGLHPGEMIVIAARPSMGKTALAMNIAEHIALDVKKTVGFFTLEMSDKALMQRAMLSRSKINMHRVRAGLLSEGDFPKLQTSAAHLADGGRLRIVDAVGATIGAIRAKARRLARRHPDLACIVLDYAQKARSTSRQAMGSREREIAEISSGLKDLAKELNIPVIVLAQLNRDVEKRKGGGRPQLSDLRESGAIEQDADVVGLLYREEYYATDEEEKRRVEGRATLIIAKQRNGPVGDIPLTFLKEYARFESRAMDAEPENREDPYASKRRHD